MGNVAGDHRRWVIYRTRLGKKGIQRHTREPAAARTSPLDFSTDRFVLAELVLEDDEFWSAMLDSKT